jgi:hypothetical protein
MVKALLLVLASLKLIVGAVLPTLTATTLSGEPMSLPGDAKGRTSVLVFGFSKAAVKLTKPWVESCRAAADARCYDVRMLEDVPKSFRGMVERGMKSGYPVELQRMTLLAYHDNEAWRGYLGVTDPKSAYVAALDADGYVREIADGSFSDAKLKHLLEVVQPSHLP